MTGQQWIAACTLLAYLSPLSFAEHHMKTRVQSRQDSNKSIPLIISNQCGEDIWPGVLTQGGGGPNSTGFKLSDGEQHTLQVSGDWQGRIWGRTNCTFGTQGSYNTSGSGRCQTGECGGLECTGTGEVPVTLAEFTMRSDQDLTFYDISLVDGYNLPMAIVMLPNNNSKLEAISQSTTNPSCVASIGELGPTLFDPYSNDQVFLGTTSNDSLPFISTTLQSTIAKWCPWDLQVFPPKAPGDGIYPYPDGNIVRPLFAPCFSACAKYNEPQYCCTGSYTRRCSPNYYSTAAKSVCPDAYSYPDDDQSSTFAIPAGAGFQISFCPGGWSTNIIADKGQDAIKHGEVRSSSDAISAKLQLRWPAMSMVVYWATFMTIVASW